MKMFFKKTVVAASVVLLSCMHVICADMVSIIGVDKHGNRLCLADSNRETVCNIIQDLVEDELVSHNTNILGEMEADHFTIFLKTKGEEVIAGVTGVICKKNQLQPEICCLQYFWIEQQFKDVVHGNLIDALIRYMKEKECSLVAYPTVWDEVNYYNRFLTYYGSVISKSGAGMAHEDDVIGYTLRKIQDADISAEGDEEDFDVVIEHQICGSFFDDRDAKNGDVFHCDLAVADIAHVDPYAFFITCSEGKVLAAATGNIVSYENAEKSCRVEGLWVDENHRRKRFGTEIMRALIKYAKNNECARITLGTFQWQAKAFFEKFGFVSTTKVSQDAQSENYANLIPYYMQKKLLSERIKYRVNN